MVCCKTRLCQQNTRSAWGQYFWHLGCLGYRFGMKVLGPTLFIAANGLIVSIAVIFFFVFYPELYQTSPTACIVNALLGAYLLLNLLSNYFLCAFTAPGSPSYCPDPSRLGEKVAIVDGRRIFQFSYHLQVAPWVSYRYCHLCKCIKPPRAHHCSVLGKCVLNMDHYCPWMATTVGYGNYRHFVLFLVFMFASCWTSVFVADTLSASMYCFSLALSGIVSTGLLLGWHAYLTVTNQTTIEFYTNFQHHSEPWFAYLFGSHGQHQHHFRNPFDEGWRKNLMRVFGDVPWYRNLLPSRHAPPPPKYPFELEDRDVKEYCMNV